MAIPEFKLGPLAWKLAPLGILVLGLHHAIELLSEGPDRPWEVSMDLALFAAWFAATVLWLFLTLRRLSNDCTASIETLKVSEAKFRGLVEALPIGIFIGDAHGAMHEVNATGAALCGCTREDILSGRIKWTDGVAAEEFPKFEIAGAEVASKGFCTPFERMIVNPDGKKVPVLMGMRALTPELNACYAVDLTERKVNQAAVVHMMELEASNRTIIEASRQKSRFLAEMSHELRTPLNAISGFAGVLHDSRVGAISEKQREFLGHILSSSRHLQRLLEDVLDISRIEAGKIDLRFEEADPAPLIRDVVDMLEKTARTGEISVVTAIDPRIGPITLDPARFKQILFNYLSNAIKFTPPGGKVKVRLASDEPGWVRIEVEDTGIGISEIDMMRLFNEFERVSRGPCAQKEGTGLGLAITRHLAEALGGRVEAKSLPGFGSTFAAVLPTKQVAANAEKLEAVLVG